MQSNSGPRGLTRRQLLAHVVAGGALVMIGAGVVAAPDASWALEVKVLKPQTMATLIQMARDIYPHDRVADEYYAIAVKDYDAAPKKEMIEAGVANLDALAKAKGAKNYLDVGWEKDRVNLLREIADSNFFQTIRGGLVTGLYNQKEIWPIFGYEGSSFEHGGYINRGFDDINWL